MGKIIKNMIIYRGNAGQAFSDKDREIIQTVLEKEFSSVLPDEDLKMVILGRLIGGTKRDCSSSVPIRFEMWHGYRRYCEEKMYWLIEIFPEKRKYTCREIEKVKKRKKF